MFGGVDLCLVICLESREGSTYVFGRVLGLVFFRNLVSFGLVLRGGGVGEVGGGIVLIRIV